MTEDLDYFKKGLHKIRKAPTFKEHRRIYAITRYHTNKQVQISNSLRARMRDALKGAIKCSSTWELVGCSYKDLVSHLESKFQENMSWDNYGQWHIDHIKPCASFDLVDSEQQKLCFNYSNLQPLWAKDNLIKGKKF